MSKLDEQIKELQFKKKKVDFLTQILKNTKDFESKSLDPEVKAEVLTLLEDFVAKAVESIEGTTTPQPVTPPKNNNPYGSKNTSQTPPKPKADGGVQVSAAEQLDFAMENRGLSGKTVRVTNAENQVVEGDVVGLMCPNVIIQTKDGLTFKVPRSEINLV